MEQNKPYRVVVTGGGSGGHVMPLIAVAESLRSKLGPQTEFLYIGSKGKIEQDAMNGAGIPAVFILTGKMRRYFSVQNFADFFKIPLGFMQALWYLLRYMPDAVFSKGGYVAVPVVLAAWMYRIPIVTQDSDAVPGMATRILGKFADRVSVAYPTAMNYFPAGSVALIGNPVRSDVLSGDAAQARNLFNLDEAKPTILVLGGSLGARVIDKAIVTLLPKLLQETQVIHQTGEAHYAETVELSKELGIEPDSHGYFPRAFLPMDELKHALAVADLVVSRAGANAIAEIAAVGKPAILIPLSSAANDEQRMNAYEIARVGGALVLEDGNLGENIFFNKITELLKDGELRGRMAQAIRVFYHPDAADAIANELILLMRQ
ncbi:MAG: undecaprenyldiphospho-muramoylpentapeptide beta-N-acetylglucosaminyltransferase [Candidatus Moranbacteria bacterium]|nr:undecaprenyldiphospho-muramoylpentapeptide beta-N-acetylglucosaminyltransferase [Candidatus Moranbacteria bacterium]